LPLAALVALVASIAALLIAYYGASPARAADGCPTTAGTHTCTFSSTGAEQTFVVPDGVSTIHVVAIGAPGAVGAMGDSAGRGAEVSGDLTVEPGDTLYVEVGGAPTGGSFPDCGLGTYCIGGFNGGGSSYFGGGGGGASDVRTEPRTVPLAITDSRLIVAAGGGGSGQAAPCNPPNTSLGGAGGDAGSDGSNGEACGSFAGGTGGKAGGQSAGGAGGSPGGQNGSLGQGGDRGGDTGGGGGGGLYGGGGGGERVVGGGLEIGAAAGGGGGSNLVPTGGTATIASGGPSITISYTDPTADTTPPNITPPPNIIVEATGPDGATVGIGTNQGNSCSASDADPNVAFSYSGLPSGNIFPIGNTTVTCTATDTSGNSSSATFAVIVRDTTAPSITAPPPITVEATGPDGAAVQYGTNQGNSCSASDVASPNLAFSYSGPQSGSTFPIGTTFITCTATDASGNSSSATFAVIVRDTTKPSVSCSVSPNRLKTSANNHKLVTVTATVNVTDGGSGDGGFELVSVESSQDDGDLGPGDVAGDIQGWTTGTADTSGQLRAERYGGARTYTLTYQGKDLAGNTTNCQATVTVPKGG
jgi:hypothetical protein